jgi:tricorn protease
MPEGYVRFPHIFQDSIVFVSEDDLWLVSTEGGRAERLTAAVNEVNHPRFSPDGQWLAFVGKDEGPTEVYVMSAQGGPSRRLTFQAAVCQVLGWTPDGQEIVFVSNAGQFTPRSRAIFAISPDGGQPQQMPFGMANAISYGPDGGIVLGRNIREPAHWKRYRGGTAGHLWCDASGSGTFQRLLNLNGNIAAPCWVGNRIYFLSDHEGVGNIYSCTPSGDDVRRHSDHQDFYARNLSSDGQRLVYHAGANLYLFDPDTDRTQPIDVDLPSLRTQRNRKFVSASHYLDSYALHPQGYAVALTTRGKAFSMGNWEGPVLQHGEPDGVRYRLLEWLNDGKRFVAVSDEIGREALVIFNPEEAEEPKVLADIEFGRAMSLEVSPRDDLVAITNHRNELIMVNLAGEQSIVVDKSDHGRIGGLSWSPDGGWLAYCFDDTAQTSVIKLCNIENGETHVITEPVAGDYCPAFDPEGKYLYFLGHRVFNPVNDSLQFERSFPRSVKPYVILLHKDSRSPFMPEPKAPGSKDKDKEKDDNGAKKSLNDTVDEESKQESGAGSLHEAEHGDEQAHQMESTAKEAADAKKPSLQIDLDGITSRVLPFPVPEGRYSKVRGIKGKALLLQSPVEGTIHLATDSHEPKGSLWSFDFESLKFEYLLDGVGSFDISRDAKTLIYHTHNRLRVLKAGDKAPKTENNEPGRDTGWLDLHRVKVSVHPAAEWKQMFAEAWRLQREHFWAEDMSGVDWQAVFNQYAPLVERISSRSELSDLFWELQGELGTSHAYEMGGEYRQGPHYRQGFLGVDWHYDAENDRYRIARIVQGDTWDEGATSPLNTPGVNVHAGDSVIAVNGQRVNAKRSPQELLVNQAKNEVQLTIEDAETKETRVVTVKALASDWTARYREWVEHNRKLVHEQSDGKVGYVHIPDMGPEGYAEFHRSYLREYDYPALLIDVRWNGGGNVSSLLLEKLARKRIAYSFSRWGQPEPYPHESPRGPMVALTNEQAGSDGDIFSHNFKLMGLGPLIGMRTWGGVIGISPSHHLVDGTHTTQPEFAYWFKDVGWNVENYGTDPDIEVDIAPQDYARGDDPQLARAIQEALRLIEERPALEPKPEDRPRRGRLLR